MFSSRPSPLCSACVSLYISMVLTAACLARKRRVVLSAWNLAPPSDYWLLSVPSTLRHHRSDYCARQHKRPYRWLEELRCMFDFGSRTEWRLCVMELVLCRCLCLAQGWRLQADFQAIHCKPDSKTKRVDTTSECLDASSYNSILSTSLSCGRHRISRYRKVLS